MVSLLTLIALAALPPVPPDLLADARCVVAIARAAPAERPLDKPGREYAARVGADIMDATGRTAQQARDVFAAALAQSRVAPGDLAMCKARMAARLADAALPPPVR